MTSILTKDVNADYGDVLVSVMNTSLTDIRVVIIKYNQKKLMNLEEKVKNIERDVKQKVKQVEKSVKSLEDTSADYGKVLLSHQKVLESIANKGRQNNLIIIIIAEEDQKDDVETTQDVISQILAENMENVRSIEMDVERISDPGEWVIQEKAHKPRPSLVTLKQPKLRNEICANAKQLKGKAGYVKDTHY